MARRAYKIRVDEVGSLEVIDPSFDVLSLLQEINPDFSIASSPLPGFNRPRLLRSRQLKTGIARSDLAGLPDVELWSVHTRLCEDFGKSLEQEYCGTTLTFLDLKIELARRLLQDCQLCARRCGIDRTRGKRGPCGLGSAAYVGEHFIHIAEESPVNPSLIINLMGCGLRCRFCQQHELLEVNEVMGSKLDTGLWQELDTVGARSLSFAGGNPDESLYAILQFLNSAPTDWQLPIVWNCHGYETQEVLSLLNGIVDVYIPDLKYMADNCAYQLSRIRGYKEVVQRAIKAMCRQGVPIYVRILILPGHLNCCHYKAIDFLESLGIPEILTVSVRGQYSPDWQIGESDGRLSDRATQYEIDSVIEYTVSKGMFVI